jgi:DNA helicase-2/ATP-dependent DNA helicase PcrA
MTVITFDDLIPAQQEVADLTAPSALVLGGAGVGKTTAALWAARRELTERGARDHPIPGGRVLFVTFSRTAVAQIRSRAPGVLTGLSEVVEILTFHGLAYRLLCSFGRYIGIDEVPTLTGEARKKLATPAPGERQMTYDDLLPQALRLMETPGPVADLLASRWRLVICDEFQDTDDLEWRLLQFLGRKARLLLLADPNQMIYGGFKKGVSEARLDAARARAGVVERTLPPGSHRDPTQVIPDAAAEIRWRRFDAVPVRTAAAEGRLLVHRGVPDDDDDRATAIADEVARLRSEGHRTIGIYAKTNSDAAGLSAALTDRRVDHVPIGFGEAYGEALAAMLTMVEYTTADEVSWPEVQTALAAVLTATVRSPKPPLVALALNQGRPLPGELDTRLARLKEGLDTTDSVNQAASVAGRAWEGFGFTTGQRAWRRAARFFGSLVSRALLDSVDPLCRLGRSVGEVRNASFVELDAGDTGAVQLMNFSQTKGREADAVILSYGSGDWYGPNAEEPFDEASRLLYVSITRARHVVIVMLPPTPHALVMPFLAYAGQ